MTSIEKAIEALRRIEAERELTEAEERRLVGLLRCKADDDAEAREATARINSTNWNARPGPGVYGEYRD